MKLKFFFLAIATTGALASCVKHEVIPPPKPKVDLSSSFSVDTSSVKITYVKDVDGFLIEPTNFRQLQSTPQLSSIVYFNTIRSSVFSDLFKVSIGRAYWDAGNGPFPSVELFRIFFENTINPAFSDNGIDGVMLEWRDRNNVLWRSREASLQSQSFVFTSVVQESDEEGDYVKFSAEFSCYMYTTDGLDSIRFDNGKYTSYFQNN